MYHRNGLYVEMREHLQVLKETRINPSAFWFYEQFSVCLYAYKKWLQKQYEQHGKLLATIRSMRVAVLGEIFTIKELARTRAEDQLPMPEEDRHKPVPCTIATPVDLAYHWAWFDAKLSQDSTSFIVEAPFDLTHHHRVAIQDKLNTMSATLRTRRTFDGQDVAEMVL